MGFQTSVNAQPAPAVEGDFASQNPRANVLASAGQLVAPAGGLRVGRFCFVNPADGTVHSAYTSGYQIGFLARNSQGLISTFLADSSMVVPQGFMVVLFDEGDFYARFEGGATAGQHVYADETNGSPVAAASAPAAVSATGIIGTTNDVAGSITNGVLTVSAPGTHGVTMPGDIITGTGIPAGVNIVSQLTGTTGVAGTYQLGPQWANLTVGAFTNGQVIQSSYIDFSAVGSGTLVPGQTLISALLAPNTELGVQVTGTAGAAGIYNVSPTQANIASGTITAAAGVDTGFIVRSNAGNNELAKISTWGV